MPDKAKVHRKKERARRRGNKTARGYGGEWSRISTMYRLCFPVCQMCRDAAADDVDHIIPFKGLDDPNRTAWSNLQALCRSCHSKKTKAGR